MKLKTRDSISDDRAIQGQKEALLQAIQARKKLRDIEKIETDYEQMCQELKSTKKHYEAFRKKVQKLNLDKIMNNEKSFCIFDGPDLDQSALHD